MKANAVKIKDGVYWVGVLDWDIRTYHGYTINGTVIMPIWYLAKIK